MYKKVVVVVGDAHFLFENVTFSPHMIPFSAYSPLSAPLGTVLTRFALLSNTKRSPRTTILLIYVGSYVYNST